ncbi:unnamed protein product [Ilex paraguariensis]|uniref:Uncharacterized protein n=1 Tax=Ilex paraguariensis TaxID=185542 RepID=A0ABC8SLF0_9AQUA
MSRACKETPTMTQLWHSVQPADLDTIDGSPGQEFSLETEHEQVWKHVVWKGDAVVDATCGNGYDTLAMLKMVADQSKRGRVYGMHVQKVAIESTSSLLDQSVSSDEKELVGLYSICHSKMDEIVPKGVTVSWMCFSRISSGGFEDSCWDDARVMLCIGDVCCLCILKATKCLPESVWFKDCFLLALFTPFWILTMGLMEASPICHLGYTVHATRAISSNFLVPAWGSRMQWISLLLGWFESCLFLSWITNAFLSDFSAGFHAFSAAFWYSLMVAATVGFLRFFFAPFQLVITVSSSIFSWFQLVFLGLLFLAVDVAGDFALDGSAHVVPWAISVHAVFQLVTYGFPATLSAGLLFSCAFLQFQVPADGYPPLLAFMDQCRTVLGHSLLSAF